MKPTMKKSAIERRNSYYANLEQSRAKRRAEKARERQLKRDLTAAEALKHRELSQLLNRWPRVQELTRKNTAMAQS